MFFKECKKAILSVTFLLYVFVVFAMYLTQFVNDCEVISPPRENGESYGFIEKEVPEILMPNAVDSLVGEYLSGSFKAYPFGFYKEVKLTEKKKEKLAAVITEVSGISKDTLDNFTDYEESSVIYVPDGNGGFTAEYKESSTPEIIIPKELSYERFRELMREADKIIGGGSKYSDDYIVSNFSNVPKTYEDALAEYNRMVYDEKITGAYARLFCDYMGIDLSIMPVFVSAALANLDRKERMSDLIYSRKISSAKLVFSRYFALLTVMAIPVVITVIHAQLCISGLYPNNEINMLAIPKWAAIWLIPNIMFASAVGILASEAFSPIIAVFIQGALWMMSIMGGSGELTGQIERFTLVCRHNNLYKAELFAADLDKFIFNRSFYTLLSLALVGLTAAVYELKRRGILNELFSGRKNIVNKSEI